MEAVRREDGANRRPPSDSFVKQSGRQQAGGTHIRQQRVKPCYNIRSASSVGNCDNRRYRCRMPSRAGRTGRTGWASCASGSRSSGCAHRTCRTNGPSCAGCPRRTSRPYRTGGCSYLCTPEQTALPPMMQSPFLLCSINSTIRRYWCAKLNTISILPSA